MIKMNVNLLDKAIKAKLWQGAEMNSLLAWLEDEYAMDDREAKAVWSGFIQRVYGNVK